jgi:hypothetical protein
MSIVRSRPANDPLSVLELFIHQAEDSGLGLVSVTEGVAQGNPCNIVTFEFEPRTLPSVKLVKLDPNLNERQLQSVFDHLENEGREVISFASLFDSGNHTNVFACRRSRITTAVDVRVLQGKMATFGGPRDPDVKPNEGLALIEESEISLYPAGLIMTPEQAGFPGLAKRLNTGVFYIACRWENFKKQRSFLQRAEIVVEANGKSATARAVDWGPGVPTRVADLSPGLAAFLGLNTDDQVVVKIPVKTVI